MSLPILKDNFQCKNLEWDSAHFGVKCAKVSLFGDLDCNERNLIKEFIRDYKFITFNIAKDSSLNQIWLSQEIKAYLIDVNVQLVLKSKDIMSDEFSNVTIQNNLSYNPTICNIAREGFQFSRFYKDKNITQESAEGVYFKWVNNSFEKPEKYFALYKDSEILGFILFSINSQNELIIELIRVCSNKQRLGIGEKMMNAVKNFALKNCNKKVRVGTQLENIKALNYYLKNGFNIDDISYTYHWWKK